MTDKQIIVDDLSCDNCPEAQRCQEQRAKKEYAINQVLQDIPSEYANVINRLKQIIPSITRCDYVLEKQLKRKEQECEKLKKELEAVYDDCKGCPTCNEALYNANLYAKECRELKQTLAEIKEIAEPYKMTIKKICGNCKKYDDCHACCYKDINCYKYTSSKTDACEEFTYLDEFIPNLLANNILQKIRECESKND